MEAPNSLEGLETILGTVVLWEGEGDGRKAAKETRAISGGSFITV